MNEEIKTAANDTLPQAGFINKIKKILRNKKNIKK